MEGEHFLVRRCAWAGVEAVAARSARSFARHTHDSYGIGLMVEGAHRSWSGRGMVEAQAGDLISCNPGEVHDGAPIGGARAWTMLYLGREVMADLGKDLSEEREGDFEFERPVIAERHRAPVFARAWHAFQEGGTVQAEESLLLLLSGLLRTVQTEAIADGAGLKRAKALIDADPAAPTTLALLAAEAGLSRWQLIRGFARATGLTPHAYIVQRRLDTARAVIAGGATLAGAAAAAGFADQSHFTRAFARRYGLPPGAWSAARR